MSRSGPPCTSAILKVKSLVVGRKSSTVHPQLPRNSYPTIDLNACTTRHFEGASRSWSPFFSLSSRMDIGPCHECSRGKAAFDRREDRPPFRARLRPCSRSFSNRPDLALARPREFEKNSGTLEPSTAEPGDSLNREEKSPRTERERKSQRRGRATERASRSARVGKGGRVDNVEPSVPPNYTAVQTHANPENKLYLLCKLAAYWRTERTVLLPRE